ncbi:MAG: ABC transporter permease [Candidatus Nomurabacteria bacterium]|nr:ABC transporter permease [Candidatus Nomurabacteria bacterium]
MSNILSRKGRILLQELVKTDFKLRYQGSFLGHLWSILKPLMLFAIMYVVFVKFLKFGGDIPHFAVALLLGNVLWGFFSEATGFGMQAIVTRGDLLRKINFPKYIVVVSATINALINLAINLVVVLIFAAFNGVQFTWLVLLAPLLILELYALSLGIALLFSGFYVKFRDVAPLWEIFMQGLFYATPIFYPITMIAAFSPMIEKIMMLSPIAQIIQDLRFVLISQENATTWGLIDNFWIAIIPLVLVVGFLVAGSLYFKKHSSKFAEIL